MFKYPIAIGLSPNTQDSDFSLALKVLLMPFFWQKGKAIEKAETWFKDKFSVKCAKSFDSGRSAYFALLKAFEIGNGDEVILQPFTCIAVVDPIIWVGAKPVYADLDKSLNIDPLKLEKLINTRTKAVIVQHTFGIPADIEKIAAIAARHQILLIEDCAHSLGARYNHKPVGSFGDAAFFSFGRDKVVSSVFGGMAIINSDNQRVKSRLENIQKILAFPKKRWIFTQIFHPVLFTIILPIYNLVIGKLILALCLRLHLVNKPVTEKEIKGIKPFGIPGKYPNALAMLLLHQLDKLEKFNTKRKYIAKYYYDHLSDLKNLKLPEKANGSVYLRFNILTDKADILLKTAKNNHIQLGNWYRNLIDPFPVNIEVMNYKKNSCPEAQKIAEMSVNLPTYPRLNDKDLEEICNLVKNVCI